MGTTIIYKRNKTMFAVIKTGGKQYKVTKGDAIKVEKLEGEAGSTIVFDEVLAYGDDNGKVTVGEPLVKDIKVSAEIIEQKKDKKVIIFKKKRRHNYRRKLGHRQQVAWIRIADIGKDVKASPAAKKAAPKKAANEETKKAPAKKETVEKAAPKKAEAKKTEKSSTKSDD